MKKKVREARSKGNKNRVKMEMLRYLERVGYPASLP